MSQVKEVVGSVSTPEVDSQTLSPKIVEKSHLPDENTTTTTGNENEGTESEICTPPYPKKVTESSATPKCEYELNKLANVTAFKEKCKKELTIDDLRNSLSKFEDAVDYGLEKAPPRVVREVPPLSVTTRQSAKGPQMVGNLENLEGQKEEEKRIKLAQQLEVKQAREEKKLKQNETNDLFAQMLRQDPIIRNIDNLSESSVSTLIRKNSSFDSSFNGQYIDSPSTDCSLTPKKRKVPAKTVTAKKSPTKKSETVAPNATKKSPTPKSETLAPQPNKKSPTKKPKIVGCDAKTAKIKPFQCYKCNNVFKVKTSVKGHFRMKHKENTYDSSKVLNVKFQCYNCTGAFDSYGKLMKHFEQNYPAETLDPKKIFVGKTNKSAALLLKLKYGPPPPEILKKMHGINKTVPSKIKKVIKVTTQVYTFKCGDCDFRHSELDKVKQHKLTHLQGK